MNRWRRRAARDDRGFTSVELAIVVPLFIWWMMLIVQYGLWWHAKQVANAAAAEAVDVAQTPDGSAADGEEAARGFLDQSGNLTNITIEVQRTAEVVTAQVQGDAPRLVPGWDWGVTARSQAPVERVIPQAER